MKTLECVDVEIVKDDHIEMDETFIVFLNSTDSSAVVDPAQTEITIIDDDGMPCYHYYLSSLNCQFCMLICGLM